MKEDRFNGAIRQKLEGIEPEFHEKDWVIFQAYSKTHLPASSWWAKGGAKLASYGAAGLVASVLIITNVIQYKQNQELKHNITELKQERLKVDPLLSTPPSIAYDSSLLHSSESKDQIAGSSEEVIPMKEATTEGAMPGEEEASAQTKKQDETVKKRIEAVTQNEEAQKLGTERVVTKNKAEAFSPHSIPAKPAEQISTERATTDNINIRRGGLVAEGRKERIKNQEVYQPVNTNNQRNTTNSWSSTARKYDKSTIEPNRSSYTKQVNNSQQTLVNTSEIASMQPRIKFEAFPDGIPVPAELTVKRKVYWSGNTNTASASSPKIRLPKEHTTQIRIGGGLDFEKKYIAKTIAASVFFTERVGLNLGVSFANVQGNEYKTEAIFQEQTHDDFRRIHAPLVPPNCKIININTNASLIRIPLSISYRLPMKSGWAALASGGITTDVRVKQKFNFDVWKNSVEINSDRVDFKPEVPLVNTVTAGVGIEKRWNSFLFQAEGYLAPSLQKPVYRSDQTTIGVKVRAFYAFGK
ncbi:MAG: hypothetical protein QM669_14705 [Siphonobacter sp.]